MTGLGGFEISTANKHQTALFGRLSQRERERERKRRSNQTKQLAGSKNGASYSESERRDRRESYPTSRKHNG